MMLFIALSMLATPQSCVDVKQQCRACPTDGKQGCSSVGIACQPIRRVCEPDTPARPKTAQTAALGHKRQ